MRTLILVLYLALMCASCAAIKADAYDFDEDGPHGGSDAWSFYDADGWGFVGASEMEEFSGGALF
jgi:hypothetical protein